MIVRCKSCNTSFAVDDSRVKDKKFAFSCPKCALENIIDNRVMLKTEKAEPVLTQEKKPSVLETARPVASRGHEDYSAKIDSAVKVKEKLQPSEEMPADLGADVDFGLGEEEPKTQQEATLKDGEEEDESITIDLDSLDIELDETLKDEGIPLDISEEELPAAEEETLIPGKAESREIKDESEDLTLDLDTLDIELDETGQNELLVGEKPEDNILPELPDEKAKIEDEGDVTLDLDSLDIELDENSGEKIFESEKPDEDEELSIPAEKKTEPAAADDDITLDLDTLDIDLSEEESIATGEKPGHEEEDILGVDEDILMEKEGGKDEDITLDLDSLDITLDETEELKKGEDIDEDEKLTLEDAGINIDDLTAEEALAISESGADTTEDEEDLKISIDEIDPNLTVENIESSLSEEEEDLKLTLDEIEPGLDIEDLEAPTSEDEEDINISIDDIDPNLTVENIESKLSEEEEDLKLTLDEIEPGLDVETLESPAAEDEEDIKISLDEIDPTLSAEHLGRELPKEKKIHAKDIEDDILSIEDEEEDEEKIQEILLDDDKDLTDMELILVDDIPEKKPPKEKPKKTREEPDDDFIMPDLDFEEDGERTGETPEAAVKKKPPVQKPAALEEDLFEDELPVIDLDDGIPAKTPVSAKAATGKKAGAKLRDELFEEELIEIDLDKKTPAQGLKPGAKKIPSIVHSGKVNFSVDLSLKHSRIFALLRITGAMLIGLLPHFAVFIVYAALSLILGFINQIIVIFRGETEEDFSEIQENTLRYLLFIWAVLLGIVDDMPVYAGREDLNHTLQMKITHPLRHSRLLALVRLSAAGILILTLPHILTIVILSLLVPAIFVAGIFSVIITGEWPHFLFNFLVWHTRYFAKVFAFATGLVDSYPPFKFD